MCALFSFVTVCQVIHDAFSETMIMKRFREAEKITELQITIRYNTTAK